MSVVNTLNTAAAPFTHPRTALSTTGQKTKRITTTIAIANGDSIGSTYFLGFVPDQAVITSIKLEGATTSGLSGESVGLYDSNGNVKNATAYASSNLNLSSSTGLPTGVTGNPVWTAGSRSIANSLNMAWQDAGDVEGPFPASGSTIKDQRYQVALTLVHAATAAGSYLVTIEYTAAE